MDEIFLELAEPFHPKRVHWRVGKTFDGGRGLLLAYLDARDVMERLDQVVGPQNWSDEYEETPSGRVICSLTLTFVEDGRQVMKSDGAGSTGFEGEKGAISDAFKRAAVKFGIGRYLYSVKAPIVDLDQGKYVPKNFDGSNHLPAYRPSIFRNWRAFTDALMEHYESIMSIKEWLDNDEIEKAKAEYQMIPNEDLMALQRAWTKGGVFTTEQTAKIKGW